MKILQHTQNAIPKCNKYHIRIVMTLVCKKNVQKEKHKQFVIFLSL